MECLQNDRMLKFRPDTLEIVRKEVNLDQPGRIDEAIDILESWVQMQPHFVKKDFSRIYLERVLITAKGLVERAKVRIDKLCTFRTLMPEFFTIPNSVKEEFGPLREVLTTAHLPEMTPDSQRVFITKMVSDTFESSLVTSFYRYLIAVSEYFMRVEYCTGFHIILDYRHGNVLNYVTKVNPIELRQIITLMTEGYGMRIKGVHVISPSKMVDTLLSMLKQVFSSKLSDRIHLHKTADTLFEYLPKEIMPADYGGKEKSLLELHKDWLEVISSNEFVEYMQDMNKANTKESCRNANQFNENYLGMPGSFRALSVD